MSNASVDEDEATFNSAPNGAPTNGHLNGYNDDGNDAMSEEDEVPLSQTSAPPRSKRKRPSYKESSSDDDTPLASSPAKKAGRKRKNADDDNTPKRKVNGGRKSKKKVKVEDESASDIDSDAAPVKKAPRKRKAPKAKAKIESDVEMSDPPSAAPIPEPSTMKTEEAPAPQAQITQVAAPVKVEEKTEDPDASPVKGKGKKRAKKEEDEEVFRWWDAGNEEGDDSVKWQTLEHNGVIFPPPYDPLPVDVKMIYNGKTVDLPPASEEVAGFYAAMIETEHAQDTVFNKNFFDDWKTVLKKHPPRDGTKITNFSLCDFRPMFEFFEAEKAKKKALTTAEKKELKKAKDELEAKYTFCMLDGRKEKVGNFRVEPPGLFRGRGEHPKKGALKLRVRPEDITLNIGEGASVPIPNMPGKWKSIQHDNTVTWLATWTENINGSHKYVFLAAGSSLKGQSDMQKFEKARDLKKHVDRIRQNYQSDLKSKVMADRQRATAMYFIDKLALRAGNEKGEDEADTVGCCSLRCEHLTLESPHWVIFDFLGKDSIRYYNRVAVDQQIFKNIRIFKDNKEDDDSLFDRVSTTILNKHLNNEMKGLTAKVFRTFNASSTFQRLLDEANLANATLQEKLNAYNKANREVAILCNHQRSAPKTHDQSMEKMRLRYKGFKYDRMKLRHVLFGIDPAFKKQPKYADDESDMDDDFVATYEDQLKLKEIEKAQKKFAKENEKLLADLKPVQGADVLAVRLENIEDDFKRLKRERGTGKATLKRDKPPEKIEEAIQKMSDKIKAFKLQIEDRDEGKEVALGTSKINYLDPRITASWCKTHDVPIEKLFSKTLITKFPWAMEVGSDWKF
ncbi:hypothetical protein C8J56DRAFT_964969 [Mycena floridula]|nr:hypothetical protein C8J56DRAFT_964969 [Mycena floridula]